MKKRQKHYNQEWHKFENKVYSKCRKVAFVLKSIAQMSLGIAMIGLLFTKVLFFTGLITEVFVSSYNLHKILDLRLMEIISLTLILAAGIELSYAFFAPGINKIVQPLMMLIAAFITYQLSSIWNMTWSIGIGLFLVSLSIPLFIYTSVEYEKYQE